MSSRLVRPRKGADVACRLERAFVWLPSVAVFTETTVRGALRRDRATRQGIIVLEGRLRYTVDAPPLTTELAPDRPGTVPPESKRRVEPVGPLPGRVLGGQ